MGYFLSSIFHDYAVANMVAPIVIMPLILLSGFYANNDMMADWLLKISYVSPAKYAFEAIVRNEYERQNTEEGGYDIVTFLDFSVGQFNCLFVLLGLALGFRLLAAISLKSLVVRVQ